ncbi:UNVERIFIED_CONTAM: hypothetical protein Slati_2228100 [Sesamum latifolium]|uniref:Uncharacterized protein n=1 Tax=Sesamum latifolium TaxID=2727402 RepID=A0AAW2WSN1_9LAMI
MPKQLKKKIAKKNGKKSRRRPPPRNLVSIPEIKASFPKVNAIYSPLTVPITQVFMAVEEKGLLTCPRSWRDTPQRPKSDKFCCFHNDYGHTMEEGRHLKNEIERLIQNGYLQEYVCWEKARGIGSYQKREGDKAKENRAASPERSLKEGARQASGYSGSSADILFGEAYDQMQLGDVSLEKVNTSLYGFAGEVVHLRGMISLPLTMGAGATRKTCMLKFLVVDVPSVYNVILGRPTLNAFQAVISVYHMKIKFPPQGE